jgi:pimeloyl-ACP methyl ester carboxylesterase
MNSVPVDLHYIDNLPVSTVLLLHAFPLDYTMWSPQLPVLTAGGFRVIAPDMRGFGGSQPPSPWTMEDAAEDLNSLLDKLGLSRCAVVGVSMGGYIALAFWSKYPERVERLVLSNSRARSDNENEIRARNEMIAAIEQEGISILPDRMLPRLLQPNPSPAAAQMVRAAIERADPAAAIYAVMAMRNRMDYSSMLHRMTCPAMIIAGENDATIPVEDSKAVADAIPGSRFVNISDSGHLSNLENPEAFNAALLKFLRGR